jgi:hypothetical protein
VSWRCCQNQRLKFNARPVTSGNRVVSERQPEHRHAENGSTALARQAVGAMKERMSEVTATPNSSQAAEMASLENHVLMALLRRPTLTRTLERHRQKVITAAHGGVPFPAIPTDLLFQIPHQFTDIVLNDSDRIIILGCLELRDGLARADCG